MFKTFIKLLLLTSALELAADNQTATVSPVLPPSTLPFKISIDTYELSLPKGWQSGALAVWGSKCLLVAGRTNGLHGFDDVDDGAGNFLPSEQNTDFFVIDFKNKVVSQRSMLDPASGLTQEAIDLLSVTAPQYHQRDHILYVTGGYGVDSATGQMNTKPHISAIDVPGIIHWVTHPTSKGSAASHIRQTSHPLLQVTGGYMGFINPHLETLLIFGQNFQGYYTETSNGDYTEQVRSFRIFDSGSDLVVQPIKAFPKNPAYRRRDLNVMPVIRPQSHNKTYEAYVALSGVFTLTEGAWTVPVLIYNDGKSEMANPDDPDTFKQGMNNYASARIGLYSQKTKDMYLLLLGGITFGYFQNGTFETDPELPFTNQITTIKIDKDNVYTQHLMENEYPVIPSTFANPGNPLLFGAGAHLMIAPGTPKYRNDVLALDQVLKKPQVVGYIIGGIQSTVPNTSSNADSAGSPYIFQVSVEPR